MRGEVYLELVGVGDVVVGGTEVRSGSDEVHVVVGIVVLLKADGVHFVAGVRGGRGEFGENLRAQ